MEAQCKISWSRPGNYELANEGGEEVPDDAPGYDAGAECTGLCIAKQLEDLARGVKEDEEKVNMKISKKMLMYFHH